MEKGSVKCQYFSDLHLECYKTWDQEVPVLADCLICAGDMGDIHSDVTKETLKRLGSLFPHVLYVPGNHEYYHNGIVPPPTMTAIDAAFLSFCSQYPSLHYLNKATWTHPAGVKFIGCCLWSQIPIAEQAKIQAFMKDYQHIYVAAEQKLTAEQHNALYEDHIQWLREELETSKDSACVVVTHYVPSFKLCVDEQDPRSKYVIATDLEAFILGHPQIRAWVCGHSHVGHQLQIGSTPCMLNPIGYPKESAGKVFTSTFTISLS